MANRNISSGAVNLEIDSECGGRIGSLTVGTTSILVTGAHSPLDWGMYPMAPYAGRVRNAVLEFDNQQFALRNNAAPHSIHGTVCDNSWNIDSAGDSFITLSTDTGPQWPFSSSITHHVSVTDTVVRCELTITAHHRMPAQLGWHPWFYQPSHVITDFNSMLQRDGFGIATLERVEPSNPPVDDCFFEPNSWPIVHIDNYSIELASDCPYWVRYDAPNGDVCIEPQSGPPNGINTKPLILEADQQFSRWMELRITKQL